MATDELRCARRGPGDHTPWVAVAGDHAGHIWRHDHAEQRLGLYAKSDVAEVAAHIRPELTPGSLVLSTQPEAVPVISYYLPRDLHYGTPLGSVTIPGVMDWRNALPKLRRSTISSVLMPMVERLAPGQRVAIVSPANLMRVPLWMTLINRDSRRWTQALDHGPTLVRIGSVDPHLASGVAVKAVVYARRGD